jgi:hypothetical protein
VKRVVLIVPRRTGVRLIIETFTAPGLGARSICDEVGLLPSLVKVKVIFWQFQVSTCFFLLKFKNFICFKLNFLLFLYYFDVLILKINFKKLKNIILIYFQIKHFKKQHFLYSQTLLLWIVSLN